MADRELTRPSWGHNVSVYRQDREAGLISGACWITPGLNEGDTLILNGTDGPIRFFVYSAEWVTSVDDMYHFSAVLEGMTVPKGKAEGSVLAGAKSFLQTLFGR